MVNNELEESRSPEKLGRDQEHFMVVALLLAILSATTTEVEYTSMIFGGISAVYALGSLYLVFEIRKAKKNISRIIKNEKYQL